MTVSLLVARIKNALTDHFDRPVTVIGELSNCKLHTSGHFYFTLKDANAAIAGVMWRHSAAKLKFRPTDGLEVVVTGRVDVYEVQGKLQVYADSISLKGAGELELAFHQLKDKLRSEGLFDPDRKTSPPRFPRAVGIVTSPTGAAIRDISRTLRRRWPATKAYLVPAQVQGDGAAQQIAAAIRALDAAPEVFQIDSIIIARGGGSLEDLWAFNEEIVARAIAAAATPIICGVGHEVDVTIADLVADVRVATPTAAAELAVPDRRDIASQLAGLRDRLRSAVTGWLEEAKAGLRAVQRSVVFRDPTWRLRAQIQRTDSLAVRLRAATKDTLASARYRLQAPTNRLAALHPARLAERARATLHRITARLAWVLGARSKRGGDALAGLVTRLHSRHPQHAFALARQRLSALHRQLEGMSYRTTVQRGFSVTRGAGGEILRSVEQVADGDTIETELTDGRVASTVGSHKPTRPAPRRATNTDPAEPTLFDHGPTPTDPPPSD
ncbi:MAG: exodeoxyribonuclease VII large subunit [Planctomycetota bacterium]|jgi:exodeoxyribonuclease VII large subunit